MSQSDSGLQPQRTTLAWGRTGMVMVVTALLVLRASLQAGAVSLLLGMGLVLLASGVGFWWAGEVRRRQLALARLGAPSRALIGFATASTVVAAAAGLMTLVLA